MTDQAEGGTFARAPVPRSFRIFLEELELPVDIGFHHFEVGAPQRLRVTAEVWLAAESFASEDSPDAAWNYDLLRDAIVRLAAARRYNLQETFVRAVFAAIADRPGVTALRVSARKPDVYPDCAAVGVEISSWGAGPG